MVDVGRGNTNAETYVSAFVSLAQLVGVELTKDWDSGRQNDTAGVSIASR